MIARFFYNIKEDANLLDKFPLDENYNKHLLFWNGSRLNYTSMYTITADTIYWMDFAPGLFDFYHAGNAPWNVDYVDRLNPGSLTTNLNIIVFVEETV